MWTTRTGRRLALAALALLVAAAPALGIGDYLTAFNTLYGTSGTALDTCSVCHTSVPDTNPYGTAFATRHTGATSVTTALVRIEPLDSDSDGFTNLTEIEDLTFPGDNSSFPATLLFYDNLKNRAATWERVTGTWTGKGVLTSSYLANDRALVKVTPLAAGTFASGRLQARVKLTSTFVKRANASLIFAYSGLTSYRYVTVQAGRVIIGQVGTVGAEATGGVKAQVSRATTLNAFHQVRVDVYASGLVNVFVDALDVPVVSYTFASADAGRVGAQALKARSVFDDFFAWTDAVLP